MGKRAITEETLSPQNPAKRQCINGSQFVDLDEMPDDNNERDYVEQFLRTIVNDFIQTSEKPPDSSISETINNSLDPDKMEEKGLKMTEMLKKLHKENEQMKRDKAGFNQKYVNVAKRFYHVEEKLRLRETEREKNDSRLKLTLEKLEQAQAALENTCRQN